MTPFKRLWCAIAGHAGVNLFPQSQRWGECKKCGALIDLWPRAWRKGRPANKKQIRNILKGQTDARD